MQVEPKRDAWRMTRILIGSLIFAFNVNTFVHGAGLFPGGFAGITILLQTIAADFFGIRLPYTLINLLINAVPAAISFKFIGKKFTLLSCATVLFTSVLTDLVPGVTLTSNALLLSIFGGMINGFAISICLNADATSGGTDFISIFLSERFGIDAFNYILAGNVVMLTVAGVLFGWERALYSIIFQFASTQVIQQLFTRYQKQTLFIVTNKPQEVYSVIRDITHHGGTLFKGEGLYEQKERSMLYSVVARSEVKHVVRAVRRVDDHAFINSIRTQSLTGRFYQRPND